MRDAGAQTDIFASTVAAAVVGSATSVLSAAVTAVVTEAVNSASNAATATGTVVDIPEATVQPSSSQRLSAERYLLLPLILVIVAYLTQ